MEPWRLSGIFVSSLKEKMPMPSAHVATGSFPTRKAANQAVQRLVASGFARNSIEVHQREEDEGFDLEIHTRPENVRRAHKLLRSSGAAFDMGQTASSLVQGVKARPVLLLGAGILAGFVLYNLIPRSSDASSQSGRTARSGGRARRTHR
jgi:hypothetical protein